MTKREFILDTLLPYREDPEKNCATDGVACVYLDDEGRKCAVGKHLKDGRWQYFEGGYENLISMFPKKEVFTEEALEQDLSDREWELMQLYHDNLLCDRAKTMEALAELEESTGEKFPELYI